MTCELTFGSLFSGVGGFDLGLERAGMRCVWQCEIDPFCERVLAKHWPDVLRVRDIRRVTSASVPAVDVLCGGFPCQDISLAGKGAGITGARSGLWSEYARLIGELRPRYVLVENVAAFLARGMGVVLGDLSALGYDAEWGVIRASDVGAPHLRARLWIVAYPDLNELRQQPGRLRGQGRPGAAFAGVDGASRALAHSQGEPVGTGLRADHWSAESCVGRVADGVPDRVDRLSSLGNALVPQIAQWIGERIVSYEADHGEDQR